MPWIRGCLNQFYDLDQPEWQQLQLTDIVFLYRFVRERERERERGRGRGREREREGEGGKEGVHAQIKLYGLD